MLTLIKAKFLRYLEPETQTEEYRQGLLYLTAFGQKYTGQGLLFPWSETQCFSRKDARPHLLLVLPGFNPDTFTDIENTSAGTNIALVYTVQALKPHAVIYFAGTQNRKLRRESLRGGFEPARHGTGMPEGITAIQYDGILTIHYDQKMENRCFHSSDVLNSHRS